MLESCNNTPHLVPLLKDL